MFGGTMIKNELFERRKHRRVKIEVPSKYREVLADDFINEKRPLEESHAINISKGGMQLVTDRAWAETGDRLIELEFSVMNRDIRIIAHVVWFARDDKADKYRSGLEFVVIKSGDVEVIGNLN
jgi:c-di-GMP-binding flagellar brake protein YcgR